MGRYYFCFLWLLCFTISCNINTADNLLDDNSTQYALGYRVEACDGYTKIEVNDPWKRGQMLERYLLVPRDKPVPAEMPAGTIVRVPLRNIVVYTAVHAAILDELGVLDDIIGVCEPRFIKSPAIRSRLEKGLIADMGESVSPNTEKMIEMGVEVILASPFQNAGYGSVEKIGIPIIECADYMEATPLGRAEWIRLFGLFTGKTALADSLFFETETRYMEIKDAVANIAHRPTLFTEKKYGSSWYVPAGESFMAHLYRDAGADYIFSYLPGAGGTPLSFETVLDKAIYGDFWIFNYSLNAEMTYQALAAEYAPYTNFKAFKEKQVYGNNTDISLFYEEAPMHPDYLLRELAAILHPELMSDEYQFRYFYQLR